MIRKVKNFTICFTICFSLAFNYGSINAAEDESELIDTSASTSTETSVLSQIEEVNENDSQIDQTEGDDDFVPSAQISEDLSVSFPVDI